MKKSIASVLWILLLNTVVWAQIPTISSFAPDSGPIGSTVVINGANFSTTPSNNIVYFGATQAVVSTSSPTQLSVTVPDGATFENVTVTTNGLTATSSKPFVVTFPSSGKLNSCSFAPNFDLNVAFPARIYVSDVDGDGKPDAVVNHDNNKISFFRNIGTPGSLSPSSFSAPVTITLNSTNPELALADLDGDGKKDIIAITQSFLNRIIVVRNTSTIGSISFASQFFLSSGNVPISITASDIDGDGRPELITANRVDGSISILRNNSAPGTLTAGSFSARVDFPVDPENYFVRAGDLDGDGKPDLVVTSPTAVSILRNTSSVGTIGAGSLATKFSYPYSYPGYTEFADLDLDNKSDLIVSQYDGIVTVFRNNATPGSLSTSSFDTPMDINLGSSGGFITVADADGDGRPDLFRTLQPVEKTVILQNNSSIGMIGFHPPVFLSTPPTTLHVAFGDLDSDSKPEMLVLKYLAASKLSIYKNIIPDFSVTPTIDSFSPIGGVQGNLITITGTNFSSNPADIIVKFNGVQASFFGTVTPTMIQVVVPPGATLGPISVTVNCESTSSTADFQANCSVSTADKNTLETIYNAMDGANWNSNTNWLSPDVRTWYGVQTNGCNVTGLSFDNDDPIGQIPPEIGNLSELVSLRINSNRLTGGIPSEIGNLNKLTSLDLIGSLDGQLPVSIGNMISLLDLNINQTQITGDIPASFGNLIDLRSLDLSQNQLSGTIPDELGNLVKLQGISLAQNHLSGSLPAVLGNLSQLERLDVSFNQLAGIVPTSIGNLSLLRLFNVSFNSFTSLPTIVGPLNSGSFVYYNNLTFESLEPNRPKISNYSPQANLPGGLVSATTGSTLTIPFFTGGAANQYQWYKGGVPISGATTQQYSKPNAQLADAGSYSVKVTNTLVPGLTLTSDPFTVTVVAGACSPPAPPVSSSVSRCAPGTVTLSASGASGTQEYRWYDVDPGGVSMASTSTFTTPSISVTTLYYVSIYDVASSCESSRATVSAVVNTPPSAPVTTAGAGCSGTAVLLSASGALPGNYRWYTLATGGTPIAGVTGDSYAPVLATNTSYFVSIFDGTCESISRTQVDATVYPLPVKPGVTAPTPLCPGSFVTINATGGVAGQYRWYDGSTLIGGEVNATLSIPSLSVTKTYQVTQIETVNNCESQKASVTASVLICTPPDIVDETSAPFFPGMIRIDLAPLVSDGEGNLDPNSIAVVGSLPSGAIAMIEGLELQIDYSGINFPGTESVNITACDLTGLCTTEILVINLTTEISIYNAVSPNADDKNEIFYLENIDKLPETKENKVTIFNRWGDTVFEVENYNNQSRAFRGLDKNGGELPSGTYFYRVSFFDAKSRTGFISLRR